MKGLKNPKHLALFLTLLSIGFFLYFFFGNNVKICRAFPVLNAVSGVIPLLLILAIYFLPTIVGQGKKNWTAISVLNLFLGWTFIGWVVALVWASCKD